MRSEGELRSKWLDLQQAKSGFVGLRPGRGPGLSTEHRIVRPHGLAEVLSDASLDKVNGGFSLI